MRPRTGKIKSGTGKTRPRTGKILLFLVGSFFLASCSLFLFPRLASADSNSPNAAIWNPSILQGPLVTCRGSASSTPPGGDTGGKPMPVCSNLCDLISTILNVAYFMIGVVIWIIAPITVAVGGIMYMFAGPNPGMTKTAKTLLTGVVWGLVITLSAYVIVSAFVGALKITGIGGFGQNACSMAGG
ncbi:MAG: hypothetical protein KGJ13_06230 [Patescibacteria group bacterium]|nr:hypothetical protein [Patescibacteria group bacterium]